MRFQSLMLAAALAGALPLASHANTFRWSRSTDLSSWDIHAQNVGVNNTLHAAVYDTLVEYNSKTFKPEPSLATEWKLIKPTQLRLTLRKGVKFSDGSAFTADDAKFSLERAKAMGVADRLYLLTNRKCGPAIHLYEKLGFQHDAEIMALFGSRYERCDVAMRYRG